MHRSGIVVDHNCCCGDCATMGCMFVPHACRAAQTCCLWNLIGIAGPGGDEELLPTMLGALGTVPNDLRQAC